MLHSCSTLIFHQQDMKKISEEVAKNRIMAMQSDATSFKPLIITITEDENVWTNQKSGIIFLQVLVMLICAIFLTIGIRSQIRFAYYQGLAPTAAQVFFFFNFFLNLFISFKKIVVSFFQQFGFIFYFFTHDRFLVHPPLTCVSF